MCVGLFGFFLCTLLAIKLGDDLVYLSVEIGYTGVFYLKAELSSLQVHQQRLLQRSRQPLVKVIVFMF